MKKYKKWDVDSSLLEVKKYNNRNDFYKKSSRAYEILRKNNLLNIGCSHMKKPYYSAIKWSINKCKKNAKKYNSRIEFQKNDKKAYEAAKNHRWLDEICQHMQFKKLPNGYWNNIKNCKQRALQYNTKTEFIKKSPHVYYISLKNKWLDEICQHMIPIGSKYKRCIYSYEFSDNHVYVGLTYNLIKREYNRNSDEKDSVTIHIRKTGIIPIRKQLTNYISVNEAIKLEGDFLKKYILEGWIPLNRNKTGGIGGSSF
jgi:hypothetical protein